MRSLLSLVVLPLLLLPACAGEPSDDEAAAEADVVGAEDIGAVTKALHLVQEGAAGKRPPPEKLAAGACFQKLGSNPKFEMRAFTEGALFLPRRAPTLSRRVVCLDLDTTLDGKPATVSFDAFELDTVLRYGLGRQTGGEAKLAFDFAFFGFEHGKIESRTGAIPAGETGSIDVPIFQGRRLEKLFVGADPANLARIDEDLVRIVYELVSKSANRAKLFSLETDPVGRLVHADNANQATLFDPVEAKYRFDHLDVHVHRKVHSLPELAREDKIVITPKLSDENEAERAIVTCTRLARPKEEDNDPWKCTGL